MRARQGLGRAIVATLVVTLLSATGAWALAAPRRAAGSPASFEHQEPPFEPSAMIGRDAEKSKGRAAPKKAPAEDRGGQPEEPSRYVLATIPHDLPITATPGGRRVVGEMPSASPYLGTAHKAWVLEKSEDGRFGRVTVPYESPVRTGWIRLQGLDLSRTAYSVHADVSEHKIVVKRLGQTVLSMPAATGAPGSPTPTGRYFVTDLVPIPEGGSFGTFAFGLSGIQPNLPDGWDGGNQLAIHGTNDPSSIGTSASAGCLRVSENSLDRLQPVLRLGTPVIIQP